MAQANRPLVNMPIEETVMGYLRQQGMQVAMFEAADWPLVKMPVECTVIMKTSVVGVHYTGVSTLPMQLIQALAASTDTQCCKSTEL